uniref:Uncharacterized protein n=1 Tax=Chromera velia CCMP2878 TaxID=1169474 RepID=A0A0G4HZF5_9ALVE|eukprot:Cvel_9728.t1-p1 / transcript=Cvel_9728.t1 / gene=Cvel_9728 / organism=Chromera_velia_CCMP2878 / gene_product=hypothetical protein / transcript_product=hypothetical protein / location=Cvel_scaffold568:55077-60288(+) / protein_length=611 / sequence_SO=supercontig / SO=protein_coding / is_pseudo=false
MYKKKCAVATRGQKSSVGPSRMQDHKRVQEVLGHLKREFLKDELQKPFFDSFKVDECEAASRFLERNSLWTPALRDSIWRVATDEVKTLASGSPLSSPTFQSPPSSSPSPEEVASLDGMRVLLCLFDMTLLLQAAVEVHQKRASPERELAFVRFAYNRYSSVVSDGSGILPDFVSTDSQEAAGQGGQRENTSSSVMAELQSDSNALDSLVENFNSDPHGEVRAFTRRRQETAKLHADPFLFLLEDTGSVSRLWPRHFDNEVAIEGRRRLDLWIGMARYLILPSDPPDALRLSDQILNTLGPDRAHMPDSLEPRERVRLEVPFSDLTPRALVTEKSENSRNRRQRRVMEMEKADLSHLNRVFEERQVTKRDREAVMRDFGAFARGRAMMEAIFEVYPEETLEATRRDSLLCDWAACVSLRDEALLRLPPEPPSDSVLSKPHTPVLSDSSKSSNRGAPETPPTVLSSPVGQADVALETFLSAAKLRETKALLKSAWARKEFRTELADRWKKGWKHRKTFSSFLKRAARSEGSWWTARWRWGKAEGVSFSEILQKDSRLMLGWKQRYADLLKNVEEGGDRDEEEEYKEGQDEEEIEEEREGGTEEDKVFFGEEW